MLAADRVEHPPQGPDDGRADRQAELLRRDGVRGAQGENCARFLSKGRPIALDGRLEWREWQDQQGNKRQSVEIIADSVQFLGGRDDAPMGGNGGFTPQSDVPVHNRDFQRPARPPAVAAAPPRRRHPVLGGSRRHRTPTAPETTPGPFFVAHSASATMDGPRLQRARFCAPHGRLVTGSTRKVFSSGKAAQPADAPA